MHSLDARVVSSSKPSRLRIFKRQAPRLLYGLSRSSPIITHGRPIRIKVTKSWYGLNPSNWIKNLAHPNGKRHEILFSYSPLKTGAPICGDGGIETEWKPFLVIQYHSILFILFLINDDRWIFLFLSKKNINYREKGWRNDLFNEIIIYRDRQLFEKNESCVTNLTPKYWEMFEEQGKGKERKGKERKEKWAKIIFRERERDKFFIFLEDNERIDEWFI